MVEDPPRPGLMVEGGTRRGGRRGGRSAGCRVRVEKSPSREDVVVDRLVVLNLIQMLHYTVV